MTHAPPALVIGEALIDIVRSGDERNYLPGGSCANVAVALARLGRPTALATRYGEDPLGDLLDAHLTDAGVDVLPGSRSAGVRTSSAEATLGPDGSATYQFDLTWSLDAQIEPDGYSVLHVGSVGAVMPPGADAVEKAVTAARRSATVSYDINARPALFGAPDEVAHRITRLVATSDVVKASDEDVHWLCPDQPVELTAAAWLRLGPAAVLLTTGRTGATVFTSRGRVDVARAPVDVVDTIGAGDTFSAAVIDGLWSLGLLGAEKRGALRDLPLAQWRRVAEYAARAAGIVASRAGANPPFREELSPLEPLWDTVTPSGAHASRKAR